MDRDLWLITRICWSHSPRFGVTPSRAPITTGTTLEFILYIFSTSSFYPWIFFKPPALLLFFDVASACVWYIYHRLLAVLEFGPPDVQDGMTLFISLLLMYILKSVAGDFKPLISCSNFVLVSFDLHDITIIAICWWKTKVFVHISHDHLLCCRLTVQIP